MSPTRQRKGLLNTPAKTAMHARYAAMIAARYVAAVSIKKPAMIKNKIETNMKEIIHESFELLF